MNHQSKKEKVTLEPLDLLKKPKSPTKESVNFYKHISTILTDTAASFSGEVGISYIDLTTGNYCSVNDQKEFYTASTIKVPLTMLVADTVTSGKKNWQDKIPYHAETDYEEGTGILCYNTQPAYSLGTLQKYAIIYSDNIAKNMLYDTLGGSETAKKEIYSRYLKKKAPDDLENISFNSKDAARILTILYEQKSKNKEYQQIYENMKNTIFHERMETDLTKNKVAHKIGSYNNFIHDIGIFEAPHPFILTIFTNGENGSQFISQLTDEIWSFQTTHYPAT